MEPRPRSGSTASLPGLTQWIHRCERCGEQMVEEHCKILCKNCGLSRDCSDP